MRYLSYISFSSELPELVNDEVLIVELLEPLLQARRRSGRYYGHHKLEVINDDLLHVIVMHSAIHYFQRLCRVLTI